MTSLKDLIESRPLADIETTIVDDFNQSEKAFATTNDVKWSLILAMIGENAVAKLEKVDTTDFPDKLRSRLETIIAEASTKFKTFSEHQRENSRVLRQIESGGDELRSIDRQLAELLERYDQLLRDAVASRDQLPVAQL